MEIFKILVKIDAVCDYIPFVSTITNLVDLFQKSVILPIMERSGKNKNRYYKYLNKKSFPRCVILLVPGVNIFVGIHDRMEKLERINEENEIARFKGQVHAQTRMLKKSNCEMAETWNQIKKFIDEDPKLKSKYEEGLKNPLSLPFPRLHTSEPVGNSFAEEWRRAKLEASYYESLETYFNIFMERNPEFLELFTKKHNAFVKKNPGAFKPDSTIKIEDID